MAKKKDPKPRPDKYAEKVSINAPLDDVLKVFSKVAHKKSGKKKE